MHLINLKDCIEFMAGDATVLREILHPDKADLKLRYSLAHATVKPGIASKPHKLKTSEVYYILEGEGLMFINNESKPISKDATIYIPPNAIQHIENTGKTNLKFICIVDPAWRVEDEEVL